MKKTLYLIIILLLTIMLSACELNIPDQDIKDEDINPGVIDKEDEEKCDHIWDDGLIEEFDGFNYNVKTCTICGEINKELVGPVTNKYVLDVKRGGLHLYEKLEKSYEPNELIQIKLNPQVNLVYKVFIDETELQIKEYKKDYWLYEFIMPEKDVQLVVYTEQISVIFNNEYIPVVISKNSDYTFKQSKPILIDNNILIVDNMNKLNIHEIPVEEGMFNFLSDQSIYDEQYTNIIDEIRLQEKVYIAYQDKDQIPCFQGEYYNVYYFIKIENKIIYIPVVKHLNGDEIICDAMYTLIKSYTDRLFFDQRISYFMTSPLVENSDCAYIINNVDEFREFYLKYKDSLKEIENYDIYKERYDDFYFSNNQLFVFVFNIKHDDKPYKILSGILNKDVIEYASRDWYIATKGAPATQFIMIDYRLNNNQVKKVSLSYYGNVLEANAFE